MRTTNRQLNKKFISCSKTRQPEIFFYLAQLRALWVKLKTFFLLTIIEHSNISKFYCFISFLFRKQQKSTNQQHCQSWHIRVPHIQISFQETIADSSKDNETVEEFDYRIRKIDADRAKQDKHNKVRILRTPSPRSKSKTPSPA